MIKQKKIDKFSLLIELLRKSDLSKDAFLQIASGICENLEYEFDIDIIENWQAMGLDIEQKDAFISLNTAKRHIDKQCFCVVDIETTGNFSTGQIIEIGAVNIVANKQIESFSSLIYAPDVPEVIKELTGIDGKMLETAPSLASVLLKFRDFLGMSVFVAHNVAFDFNFISKSLQNLGYPPLLNRRLCTVELAKRTIASTHYKLSVLKEMLGITNTHHRAFSDAISAAEILNYATKNIPSEIHSSEDLIYFSKNAPSLKLKEEI